MKILFAFAVGFAFLTSCVSSPHPSQVPPGAVPAADVDYSSRKGWYQRSDNYLLYVNNSERVQDVPLARVRKVIDVKSPKVRNPYFDFVDVWYESGNGNRLVSRTTEVEVISIDLGIRYARLVQIRAESPTRFLIAVDLVPTLNNENRTYPEKSMLVRQIFQLDADTSGSGQHTLKVVGGRKI